jgi:hypothetical protein
VYEKYIGGSDFVGNHRNDNSLELFTVNLGLGLCFNLIDELRIRIDTNVYIPLKDEDRLYNYGRNGTVKLGFDYFFK